MTMSSFTGIIIISRVVQWAHWRSQRRRQQLAQRREKGSSGDRPVHLGAPESEMVGLLLREHALELLSGGSRELTLRHLSLELGTPHQALRVRRQHVLHVLLHVEPERLRREVTQL